MDAASNDILTDITEWSDGKRFIAPDANDIGHINDALREVLRFEAALPSSQTPVVVSLLNKHHWITITYSLLISGFLLLARYFQRHTKDCKSIHFSRKTTSLSSTLPSDAMSRSSSTLTTPPAISMMRTTIEKSMAMERTTLFMCTYTRTRTYFSDTLSTTTTKMTIIESMSSSLPYQR